LRIGVLTAGGDAPGLNAAIRAIGQIALRDGHEVIGIANGWAGLASEYAGRPLVASDFQGVIAQGGTLLGTARYNLDDPAGGRERVLAAIDEHLDGLISIGGDGTHRISTWLADHGAPIVGVPKTLDNDLLGTDYCIGFDTAISIVAESIDRLYTTAASHHRVMVVETMGRLTGWVAAMGGLAGGADMIVIPEFPVTMDDIMKHLERRVEAGLAFSIVVVAEACAWRRGAWVSSSRRKLKSTRTSKFAPRSSVTCSAAAARRRTTASGPRASVPAPTTP
jgi:6-phosphofructokinase 1